MTKHFVYKTTNLLNGKQYIGEHSRLNDNYLGSGYLIKRAIKKYGKNNFQREILEYFDTKQEAFDAQEKYISQFNTLSPKGYNISPKGGHNVKGCISEETKKKLSNSLKGKPGKKGENNGMWHKGYLFEKENNPFFGKRHSEESCKKMSKSRTAVSFSDEHKLNLSKSLSGIHNPMFGLRGENNPNFGSKRSEQTKQKMRGRKKTIEEIQKITKSNKNRPKHKCPHCSKEMNAMNFKKWHGDNCKNKISI